MKTRFFVYGSTEEKKYDFRVILLLMLLLFMLWKARPKPAKKFLTGGEMCFTLFISLSFTCVVCFQKRSSSSKDFVRKSVSVFTCMYICMCMRCCCSLFIVYTFTCKIITHVFYV